MYAPFFLNYYYYYTELERHKSASLGKTKTGAHTMEPARRKPLPLMYAAAGPHKDSTLLTVAGLPTATRPGAQLDDHNSPSSQQQPFLKATTPQTPKLSPWLAFHGPHPTGQRMIAGLPVATRPGSDELKTGLTNRAAEAKQASLWLHALALIPLGLTMGLRRSRPPRSYAPWCPA